MVFRHHRPQLAYIQSDAALKELALTSLSICTSNKVLAAGLNCCLCRVGAKWFLSPGTTGPAIGPQPHLRTSKASSASLARWQACKMPAYVASSGVRPPSTISVTTRTWRANSVSVRQKVELHNNTIKSRNKARDAYQETKFDHGRGHMQRMRTTSPNRKCAA